MKKLGLVFLMIGLGLPGLASYTSNSVSGSFDDPAVWSPSPVPSEKDRTITIISGAIIYKEGNFSWDAKVTIQQNAKFNVGSGFSTGYGGIDIFGELDVDGKLSGSNGGAAFNVKNGAVVTVNGVADNTNITVENGGVLIVNGDFSLSQTLTINQGGSVIINGNFLNGVVKNYGSFVVNGDYVNNAGDGIEVFGTGRTEVYGNMTGNQNFRVYKVGALLVFGNFASTGSNVHIQGTLVVAGDFLTSSNTTVNGADGNLIVGGNFKASGGINTKSDNLYILDPNSDIDYPGKGNKTDYGRLDDFLYNEASNKDLIDLVKDVLPDYNELSSVNQWVGADDDNWGNLKNWTANKIPEPGASVRIKSSGFPPVIPSGSQVVVNFMTINPSAQLKLSPGAQLTVNGKLTIAETGSLVMEHQYGVGGMSSLITNGQVVGQVTTRMTLPQNQWFYLGSSRKNAIFSDFGAGNDGISISAFRSNKYWPIKSTLAGNALRTMEGIATNFLPSESDMDGDGQADSRLIEYKGEINTDVVSRTFDIAGFHLLANPYPAFVDWQGGEGWERVNIDPTIWYRAKIGGEMAFITYNKDAIPGAKVALYPDSEVNFTSEAELALIPPMQAVWIKTLSPNVTTTIKPNARRHSMEISRLKSASSSSEGSVIRIEAENTYSRDGAVIFFAEGFSEAYENGDGEKYFNDSKNIPEVYTRAGNRSLAINGLSELTDGIKTIPLSVRNRVEGEVMLSFDMRYFNGQHAVYMEDREEGAFINLAQQSTYKYEVKDLGDNHDRFVLHLYKITTAVEEASIDKEEVSAGNEINIKSIGNKALVSVSMDVIQEGAGQIEVYTIDGSKLNSVSAQSSRTLVILPNENGVYIIRAKFGNLIKSERVLVSGK